MYFKYSKSAQKSAFIIANPYRQPPAFSVLKRNRFIYNPYGYFK